jgi:hypothetical protein
MAINREKINFQARERYNRNKQVIDDHKKSNPCSCGEADICCLEFHHRDTSTKLFNISFRGKQCSIKRLCAEIEKCIVVCKNCHTKLHSNGQDEKLEELIKETDILLSGKLEKHERHKLHRNKQKYVSKLYVRDYKIENNCEKCGENDHNCMVFHHDDPDSKEAKIPQLYKYGVKKVQREIDKCSLLCHNCHSKLHHTPYPMAL